MDGNLVMQLMGLTNQLRRNADAITARYGGARFTGMQSFVVAYLADHAEREQEVFQRDIERDFYISRSTASGILSLMEKNDLVYRLSVPQDARLKKLVPTEKALAINASIRADLQQMDEYLVGSLSPEEQETMLRLIGRLWQGMDNANRAIGLEPKPHGHGPD